MQPTITALRLGPRLRGRRPGRCLPLLAALSALAAAPGSAAAPPSPGAAAEEQKRAAARAHADRGFDLYEQGKYREAVEAFLEAERHHHAPTVVLYRSRAYAKLGWLLQAKTSYQEIASERLDASAPAPFVEAQRDAVKELAALEPRIPGILFVIHGAPPEQVEVAVDRYPVPARRRGRPVPLNPGEHVVTIRAPGLPAVTRRVLLEEGKIEPIVLDLDRPAPGAGAPAGAGKPEAAPGAPAAPVAVKGEASTGPRVVEPARGSLVPAAIALTAGGLGLGLGAVTGALALGRRSELDGLCPERRCGLGSVEDLQQATSAHAAADTLATISTVSLVAGGVAAALGVTLAIVRPGGESAGVSEVGLGPGWIGARGRF